MEHTPTKHFDLSTKTIDNPSDPYGLTKAMDSAYNQGITHAIGIVEAYFDKGLLQLNAGQLLNSLNKLKK